MSAHDRTISAHSPLCTCSHDLLDRKGFLGLGAATVVAASGSPSPAAAAPGFIASTTPGAELVTLGTAAGPPPIAGRVGTSSALVVDGKTFVVDCGRSSLTQFVNAGLTLDSLAGIFITHLHADHVCDLFNYFLLGAGWPAPEHSVRTPVAVFGPSSAGLPLPAAFPPGRVAGTVDPAQPVPGTADLMRDCTQAFAYSINIFMRDSNTADISALMSVHELSRPAIAGALGPTAPPMEPIDVARFGDVTVTAILVPHGACFPAYAFRFDTRHGSVVFSGDTTPTPNLIALARGADLLVHEAINLDIYRSRGIPPALLSHLENSHTDVLAIGGIAKAAGVKAVILSHLAPGNPALMSEEQWETLARRGASIANYEGTIGVATDLARYDLRGNRTA